MHQSDSFDQAKLLVIKLGSNLLSTSEGTLDRERIRLIASEVSELSKAGTKAIIVSSGAVAAGMGATGRTDRPGGLPTLQALAAIGQSMLMSAYTDAFEPHGLLAAQALLTQDDLENRERDINARYTLESLLEMGTVPIINENDTVTTRELTFGDNDMLSAIIAVKTSADLLLLLTDIDGLYTKNPNKFEDAEHLSRIAEFTPALEEMASGSDSKVGKGGMATKIQAARHATNFGVPTVIANGRSDSVIHNILKGSFRGTIFEAQKKRTSRSQLRTHWISSRRPKGTVTVDDGAKRALVEKGSSLLPVGIVQVDGEFDRGDTISICSGDGDEFARGISNFTAGELEKLKGLRVDDAAETLGVQCSYSEAVHRNNLAML